MEFAEYRDYKLICEKTRMVTLLVPFFIISQKHSYYSNYSSYNSADTLIPERRCSSRTFRYGYLVTT